MKVTDLFAIHSIYIQACLGNIEKANECLSYHIRNTATRVILLSDASLSGAHAG